MNIIYVFFDLKIYLSMYFFVVMGHVFFAYRIIYKNISCDQKNKLIYIALFLQTYHNFYSLFHLKIKWNNTKY